VSQYQPGNYWLNRQNFCVPVIGLITTFCPPMTTGGEQLVVQTGEERFVVDCRVNPVKLVGHVKITYGPEGMRVSCGCGTIVSREMVPLPYVPQQVVP